MEWGTTVRGRLLTFLVCFFFSSRRRHTRWTGDWSSDVCSSDLSRDGCRSGSCGTRSWWRRGGTRSDKRTGSETSCGTRDGGRGRGRFGRSTRPRRPQCSLHASWIAGTPLPVPRPPPPVPFDMRIGITCYPTYGGSGAVASALGLELARRGHEIHFVSYASPFRLRGYAERVTFHEVTQLEYPLFEQSSPYALALAVKQHEVAKREQLDLMHVHYAIPHAATAWLAKQMLLHEQLDLKIVTTLHGTDITLVGQDPSYYTLTKLSIAQSDKVTAVSAYLRDETYRAFGCGQCDLRVIPNFISTV